MLISTDWISLVLSLVALWNSARRVSAISGRDLNRRVNLSRSLLDRAILGLMFSAELVSLLNTLKAVLDG